MQQAQMCGSLGFDSVIYEYLRCKDFQGCYVASRL